MMEDVEDENLVHDLPTGELTAPINAVLVANKPLDDAVRLNSSHLTRVKNVMLTNANNLFLECQTEVARYQWGVERNRIASTQFTIQQHSNVKSAVRQDDIDQ